MSDAKKLLSTAEVASIAARCEAATPGRWEALGREIVIWQGYSDDCRRVLHHATDADLVFIAAARTDVPALLADRAALVAERDEALGRLNAAMLRPTEAAIAYGEECARLDYEAIRHDRDRLRTKLAEVERERDEAVAALHGHDATANEMAQRALDALAERAALAAKLAEVERERDMMRRPSNAAARQLFTERDAAIAERDRLAGELKAGTAFYNVAVRQRDSAWTDVNRLIAERDRLAGELRAARVTGGEGRPVEIFACEVSHIVLRVDTHYVVRLHPTCEACATEASVYRAAPQMPGVERHGVGCRSINTGCDGDCDCKPAPSSAVLRCSFCPHDETEAGRVIYTCDRCHRDVCSECSDNVGAGVVCDRCKPAPSSAGEGSGT